MNIPSFSLSRGESNGNIPIGQVGAVLILAFMLTGFAGYFANVKEYEYYSDTYNQVSAIEPIVEYSVINEWEVYNPDTNVTGWYQVPGTDVVIPTTKIANKYIINARLLDYLPNDNHKMHPESGLHSDEIKYCYSKTNIPNMEVVAQGAWMESAGYEMKYFSFEDNAWYNTDMRPFWSQWKTNQTFDRYSINGWEGWTYIQSGGSEIDWDINAGQTSEATPIYMGGYGYGRLQELNQAQPTSDNIQASVVVTVNKQVSEDQFMLQFPTATYGNDSSHYSALWPIGKTNWVEGEIIGTSIPRATATEEPQYASGLYGLYSQSRWYGENPGWQLIYSYTLEESASHVWIYDADNKLFWPAVWSEGIQRWVKDKDHAVGCKELVFLSTNSVPATPDWSFDTERQLWVTNYNNETYPDPDAGGNSIPLLRTYIPHVSDASYAAFLEPIVINSTETELTEPGIANWGNNELIGSITFWGERGLRISPYYNEGTSYGIYWKVPDNYEMYDKFICTIDLINKTQTCRGVISYTNMLNYTVGDHEYEMVCCYAGTTNPVPKDQWPEQFPKVEYGTSNFLSLTFTELADSEITPGSGVTKDDLWAYVLSTTVATDPKGLLWGDPEFYFQYYLPDEFSYYIVQVEIGKDEHGHQIYKDFARMNKEIRVLLEGFVKYGKKITINEQTFDIIDGNIHLPLPPDPDDPTKQEYADYPMSGMAIEWRPHPIKDVQPENWPTEIKLIFTLGGGYTYSLGYASQTPVEIKDGEKVIYTTIAACVMSGEGNWYFSGDVKDIVVIKSEGKAFDITSGLFQMTAGQAILTFMGISIIGLQMVSYFSNRRLDWAGWVSVVGVMILAFGLLDMYT